MTEKTPTSLSRCAGHGRPSPLKCERAHHFLAVDFSTRTHRWLGAGNSNEQSACCLFILDSGNPRWRGTQSEGPCLARLPRVRQVRPWSPSYRRDGRSPELATGNARRAERPICALAVCPTLAWRGMATWVSRGERRRLRRDLARNRDVRFSRGPDVTRRLPEPSADARELRRLSLKFCGCSRQGRRAQDVCRRPHSSGCRE